VIRVNPEFYRPAEVDLLQADPTRARDILKWSPQVSFEDLAGRMMLADLKGKESQ
jgi:GDPmannose 4,6-dehydratase